MKTTVAKGFESIYFHYLDWFQARAEQGAVSVEREAFPQYQSFHEDVFENDRMILNRMYYTVPLSPSASRSGKLELFAFSELNLMEKENGSIADLYTVEYRIE